MVGKESSSVRTDLIVTNDDFKRFIYMLKLMCCAVFSIVFSPAFAGKDSLILKKSFNPIPTKILNDTLLKIEGTPLDTFDCKPDGIIIVRSWDGHIINDWVNRFLVPEKNEKIRMGMNYDSQKCTFTWSEYWQKPWNEGKGILNLETHYCRRQIDTIRFQTPINFDSTTAFTYFYEIQLGRDAFNFECKVSSTEKLKKKDKEYIEKLFNEMDYWDLIESERPCRFVQELYNNKNLSRKVRKKIWCWCGH